MTLSITAISRHFVVQVVDRRITTPQQILSEEHEKCFSLQGPSYRLTITFSGLALIGSYATKNWLMDAILSIAQSNYDLNYIFENLRDRLNDHFSNHPTLRRLSPQQRILEIMCAGYAATPTSTMPIYGKISNVVDPGGRFILDRTAVSDQAPADWAEVIIGGSGATLAGSHKSTIIDRMRAGAPAHAICSILENVVREVANDPKSLGLVGEQLDTITLHADPSIPIQGGGYTAVPQSSIRIPSNITILPGGGTFAYKGMLIEDISDEPIPMSVPKVHRNSPCPCGSGKKFRNCHGNPKLNRAAVPILPGLPGGNRLK